MRRANCSNADWVVICRSSYPSRIASVRSPIGIRYGCWFDSSLMAVNRLFPRLMTFGGSPSFALSALTVFSSNPDHLHDRVQARTGGDSPDVTLGLVHQIFDHHHLLCEGVHHDLIQQGELPVILDVWAQEHIRRDDL